MSTMAFLSQLRNRGVRLWLEGDRLRIKAASGVLTVALKEELAARKPELIQFMQEAQAQVGVGPFLSQLRKIGVRIWLDGEKLRVKAAGGLFTPELKLQMAQQKVEIIRFLRAAQGHAADDSTDGMDPGQLRQWILQQLLPNASVHHLAVAYHCDGRLDRALLSAALQQVVAKHPTLQFAFSGGGAIPRLRTDGPCAPIDVEETLITVEDDPSGDAGNRAILQIVEHPFRLDTAPLIRLGMVTYGAERTAVVLVMHRIIGDDCSLHILARELGRAYRSLLGEPLAPAEDPTPRYRKLLDDRIRFFGSETYKERLRWWTRRLDGWPFVFELPTDNPRKGVLSFDGSRIQVPFSSSMSHGVDAFCSESGSPRRDVFLAAFCTLLHRYSGKDHFLIAMPTDKRFEGAEQDLIGRFSNLVPLRIDMMGVPSFDTVLRRIREEYREASENGDVFVPHIVDELQQDADLFRNPMFQVKYVYKHTQEPTWNLPGITCRPVMLSNRSALFEITLRVVRNGGDHMELEYNAQLFDRETVVRMSQHLICLLTGGLKQSKHPVRDLPMLGEDERLGLLVKWNQTEADYALDQPLDALFARRVAATPDRPAVLPFEAPILTYAELNERVESLASYLVSRGMTQSTFVGIFAPPCLDAVVAVLAVLRVGAAYVPLDPGLPLPRLAFMLEDTGTRLVLTLEDLGGSLPLPGIELVYLDGTLPASPVSTSWESAHAHHGDQAAYVIYTPMSTGKPKAVVASHRAVANRLHWLQAVFPLSSDDRLLQRTPLTSGTSSNELLWPLIHGASLVLPSMGKVTNYGALIRLITLSGVTTLHLVPYGLEKMMQEPLIQECRGLKRVFCGAEALSQSLVAEFTRKMPNTELVNLYGSTEAGGEIASWVCTSSDKQEIALIGRPIANTRIYILDGQMRPVPVGVPGELYVSGVGLADGYLNRKALTRERFLANPFGSGTYARLFKTCDRARYLADGNIEFLGRTDSQVKVRGIRVDLDEIEAALSAHDSIGACAADFRRDAFGEPKLVAYYVSKEPASVSHAELDAFLATTLPRDIIPSTYVRTENMPRSSTGKVARSRLPIPEEFLRQRDAFPRAYSEVERVIARIWREVLRVDKVGVDENFFDLGGDSLQLLDVYHRLPEMLKRGLAPADLFHYPTVHELGLTLENEVDEADFEARRGDMVEQVGQLVASWEEAPGMNLAVIGWAGRFPGAGSPSELWQNLIEGREAITVFSKEEADADADEDLLEDPYYVPARGVLDDVRMFDAAFFGLTTKEAVLTDPQQRLFLECTYEALEHSGYASSKSDRSIGLFGGCGDGYYYTNHLRNNPRVSESVDGFLVQIGNGKDFLTTRTSHLLGLRGTAVTVQAGAATSMMAVAGASHALLAGECHAAIAGGVYLGPTGRWGYLRRTDESLSPDGHCRPFDVAAGGQVPGQGCAVVVLKKLADAVVDGDTVHAVIRGLALANNGGRGSFGSPCVETWVETIERAHKSAGIHPSTVGYIETEGSGNPAHDALEIEALGRVYRQAGMADGACALGAIKANIGSLDHAASAAAVIKACMAVREGLIPPNIHYQAPLRPDLFSGTPFVMNTQSVPWVADGVPRRAGVNVFDAGGHHAHLIVEEPPLLPPAPRQRPWHILTLSAKTGEALEAMTGALARHIQARPHLDFSDVCYTLNTGREPMKHRRMVVAPSTHEAILELERHNPERVFSRVAVDRDRPIAFMFPGQGVQYQNMGRQLYQVEPTYREVVDRCWSMVGLNAPELYENLTQHNQGSRSEKLHQTYVTQPATFITEYALARLLIKWGIRPSAMIGNSLGEYVAATLAGVFSLEDALDLVCTRGRLMQGLPEGRQLAVGLSEEEVTPLLNDQLSLAGMAGPRQAMVAGSKQAIDTLKAHLDASGIMCFRLFTSHAFHSYMMDPIMPAFRAAVAQVTLHPPKIPFISTITGTWITNAEAMDPDYWARQFRLPVRFSKGLEELFGKWHDLIALEVGPDKQLTSMAIRHPAKTKHHMVLATMRQPLEEESDVHHLLNAVGRLWLNGFPLDWDGFHGERRNRRLVLPTYPFQKVPTWMGRPGDWDVLSDQMLQGEAMPLVEAEDAFRAVPTDLVPPRDAVETEIAAYWQQVLGVSELGVFDDFFELGGNSLIGVRLVNLLRRKLRVPLANPILLQKRSVAALSDYIKEIRALGSGEGDQNAIIVQLQRGERGSTPLFLFHPIEGDILIYRQLVDYLGFKQPVFAVQAKSLVGGDAFTDIPTQARAYLEDIRKLQPRGPYLLTGFSYGGYLAYEISRLLIAEGEKVGLTALIDSSHPSTIHMDMQNPVEILKFLTGYVIDFPKEEYQGLTDEEQIAFAEARVRAANRASLIPPVFGLEMCRTWLGHQKALGSYRPKPLMGRVIFFNATELMGDTNGGGYYPWLDLVQGGLELHHVPGHHISIMNVPEQVKVIAKHLKRALKTIR